MFGIIRPCRHRLSAGLHADWVAHLCGLCLTLRDEHGQLARCVTNYDGLAISALVEAQTAGKRRRKAGPCALRGMRTASVAQGEGARLAAAVSLVLASAKLDDHVADGDGAFGRRAMAGVGRRVAARWASDGAASGAGVGFDASTLTAAIGRQCGVESAVTSGDEVLTVTAPTETATAAAFAHTAVLAGVPENREPLAEAGRLFGRTAHLLDAVEDMAADEVSGAFNPLTATGTSLEHARRLCDDAVLGVRLALDECTFHQGKLVHALLVHELRHAVRRTFGHIQNGGPQYPGPPPGWQGRYPPGGQYPQGTGQPYGQYPQGPGQPYGQYPQAPTPPGAPPPPHMPTAQGGSGGGDGRGGGCWVPKFREPPVRRNPLLGCLVGTYMCCTCQFCCRDPYPGPCDGRPHASMDCGSCDCSCCECCECCDGC